MQRLLLVAILLLSLLFCFCHVEAMIDIGVNLTSKKFNGKVDRILRDASNAGVEGIIITGTSLDSSKAAIHLIRNTQVTYGITLKCTVGVHPHDASQFTRIRNLDEQLENLIEENRDIVVAVGETGLDFNRNFSPQDVQKDAFRQQMALAARVQLPVFLHERDAHEDFVTILKEFPDVRKCVHCYTDPSLEHLNALVDLGAMIGQTAWMTDEQRGQALCAIVPRIPPNRLMIETDAPFLTPQNMIGYRRVRFNEPAYLPFVVKRLAELYGRSESEVRSKTLDNTKAFFNM